MKWLIPRNSRFEVSRIPQLLREANIPTTHVWFDLVCIPQGSSDLPRQEQEIAKQADIFRHAAACIAWWNDLEKWDNLLTAATYLSFCWLRDHSGFPTPNIDDYIRQFEDTANDASDLFRKIHFPTIPKATSDAEENGNRLLALEERTSLHNAWCCSRPLSGCRNGNRFLSRFSRLDSYLPYGEDVPGPDWWTSLWTLQEACLCSSLVFASSSFELFQTPTGLNITLETLRYLITQLKEPSQTRSTRCLARLFPFEFGMSPMEILIQAGRRECSGSRAPAIMNAIGVTDWYGSRNSTKNPTVAEPIELVLGQYPLEFVREAARKIGPSFYLSTSSNCQSFAMGALLPIFAREESLSVRYMNYGIDSFTQYGDYEPWQIHLVDGKCVVVMNAAMILASSGGESRVHERKKDSATDPVLRARIYGMPAISEGEVGLQDVLESSLAAAAEDTHAFAVALVQNSAIEVQFGIILQGRPDGSGWLQLSKRGVYDMSIRDRQEEEDFSPRRKWAYTAQPQAVRWQCKE